MTLGLLAGNTSVRFAALEGRTLRDAGRIPWDDLSARGSELALLIARHGCREVIAGSVRDDLLARLEAWIPAEARPIRLARRDFPIPIESRYERPEEAGTDRLLNALAARERAGARGAIAVDFGTAVSLSAVSRGGVFLGGLIAAGARTVAAGLERRTPRLPGVEAARPSRFIQTSTGGALSSGLYIEVSCGVRGMLQGLLAEMAREDGAARPLVIATGGEADLLARDIPEIEVVVPALGLEGLAIAWAHAG